MQEGESQHSETLEKRNIHGALVITKKSWEARMCLLPHFGPEHVVLCKVRLNYYLSFEESQGEA